MWLTKSLYDFTIIIILTENLNLNDQNNPKYQTNNSVSYHNFSEQMQKKKKKFCERILKR